MQASSAHYARHWLQYRLPEFTAIIATASTARNNRSTLPTIFPGQQKRRLAKAAPKPAGRCASGLARHQRRMTFSEGVSASI